MKLRRYALFLSAAILTFMIGVAAALLFGGTTLFQHRHETRTRCGRMTLLPDNRSRMTVYTVYRSDGTIVKSYEVEKAGGLERLTLTNDDDPPPVPPPGYIPPSKR